MNWGEEPEPVGYNDTSYHFSSSSLFESRTSVEVLKENTSTSHSVHKRLRENSPVKLSRHIKQRVKREVLSDEDFDVSDRDEAGLTKDEDRIRVTLENAIIISDSDNDGSEKDSDS